MKKKLLYFLLSFFILISQSLIFIPSFSQKANALTSGWVCSVSSVDPNPVTSDDTIIKGLTINTNYAVPGNKYSVYMDAKGGSDFVEKIKVGDLTANDSHQLIINTPFDMDGKTTGDHGTKFEANTDLRFWVVPPPFSEGRIESQTFGLGSIDRANSLASCETSIAINQGINGNNDTSKCSIVASGEGLGKPVILKTTFTPNLIDTYNKPEYKYFYIINRLPGKEQLNPDGRIGWGDYPYSQIVNDGITLTQFDDAHTTYNFDAGPYQAELYLKFGGLAPICTATFNVDQNGINQTTNAFEAGQGLYACTPVLDDAGYPKSYTCHTAIGDVSTDGPGFIRNILSLILGLAGGILLIVIIINGYKFIFSQGDAEKIKDAREGIIAAIMGIFLIIFSLTLLTIVTSNILQIPGFGN